MSDGDWYVDSLGHELRAAELRVGRLEEALRAIAEVEADYAFANAAAQVANMARLARAALVRTGEEHGTSQEREAPQAVPVAEIGEPSGDSA